MSIPCDRQQPPADETLLEAAPTEDTGTMSEQGNQDRSNDISDHFSYNVDSLSKDQDSDSDSQATERYVIPMRRKPGWLVGFGFNGPLRQYFSLYLAVSQREGERGKEGQMRAKMSKQPHPHLLQAQ